MYFLSIPRWINGLKIAELDTPTLHSPSYCPADIRIKELTAVAE